MFVVNGDSERAEHVCKEVSLCWDCCVDLFFIFFFFFGYFWEWLIQKTISSSIF